MGSQLMRSNTYLLSWTCYGTWLHGDWRGSVDRHHNTPGEPYLNPDAEHWQCRRDAMKQDPYSLDHPRRVVVLESIRRLCHNRHWTLHAIHVRNNHVHMVVTADRLPERVLHDCKSAASRGLNKAGYENNDRIRWTRGGSTKWINDDAYFANAVNYVLNKQGEPMTRWPDDA